MNWMEVALLVLGVGAFAASFLLPEKKKAQEVQEIDTDVIKCLIEKEMETAKNRVTEVVDETLEYAVEKTERASERISNEKIMAISEYSETVMTDLNKAHQEVMFLYDMLNDKHKNLKETVKKVDQQTKEAQEKTNLMIEKKAQLENTIQNAEKNVSEPVLSPLLAVKLATEQLPMQKVYEAPKTEENQMNPVQQNKIETALNDEKNNNVSGHIEVYSFAKQAPHVERPVAKEMQAVNLEKNVSQKVKESVKQKKSETIDVENNNDKILRLHRAGISNVDIAKELGLGVGEVKLVINLFKGAV